MSSNHHRQRAGALVAALCCALVLAACGSSSSKTSTGAATATGKADTFPVTVASGTSTLTINSQPKAIVSLSPTATESLFAIGAGSQVIAVDDQSNYPPNAPKTDLSGFKPNVEAIAAKKPDLVVVADDSSGLSASLAKVNIPTIVDNAANNLDEAYAQIQDLGKATGHTAAAAKVVSDMKQKIAGEVKNAPRRTPPLKVYHELDDTLYSATSSTFIGQVYKMLGADNIADAADKSGTGYPQLSAEYVVKANPDVIFLADAHCCNQNQQTVAARPGFAGINAVKNGAVVALDEDVASRWGPRVPDLVAAVAAGLKKAPAA
jgi:iron complex transport system substrate-binding protein